MGISTSYPLLDIFFTILMIFAWTLYIWVAITVLFDVFRRDMSGWAKALWVLVIVVLSWIGVLIYLIINHRGMTERRVQEARATQVQFDEFVRATAGGGGPAGEIERAKKLLDSGTIDQSEFQRIKTKALAG